MKKYPKYKDSGVEWIGEIPDGWERVKVKYVFDLIGGFPFDSEDMTNEEMEFPIIRIGNVTSGLVDIYFSGELSPRHTMVETGDYVVSLTGDFNIREWKNQVSLLNQRCGLIKVKSQRDGSIPLRFLYYFLPFSFKILGETKFFTTLKNLSNGDFLDIEVVVPPLPEQQEIVTYLDQKTTLIDQIISNSEKKIELLKEKRNATINHAVTKGLNPKVKMKDSGVEWIGEIPEGWSLGKFNYYISIRHGYQFRDYDFTENGIKVVKITQLHKDGYLDLSNCSFIDEGRIGFFEDIVIKEKDILMCLTGGTIGKIIRVGSVTEPLVQNYRVGHFSSKDEKVISDDYLFLLMTSNVIYGQIFYEIRETGQPNIGIEDFRKMKITLPPLREQEQIVTYLDQKTKEIDELISSEQKRIELLKEYRLSLISEVVTGKIKIN